MNTTERIVESYYRLCWGCFTYPDVKVEGGNNRQLDLLAYSLREGAQYHIETSVTHELSWRATWDKLEAKFESKFFGAPKESYNEDSEFARGRNYSIEIQRAYKSVGFAIGKVQRVWVTWIKPTEPEFEASLRLYNRSKRLGNRPIRVISFRDEVLPQLLSSVGRSNYSDDVLRTMSLLRQFEHQTARVTPPLR